MEANLAHIGLDHDLPPPLTPPECDLRGLEWMPLYGDRLFTSDFEAKASAEEFRAAVHLWWEAWKQVPAASLPDDDDILCRLGGLGRNKRAWHRVRSMALHGFERCRDGRWYHRALAEHAVESSGRRIRSRQNRDALLERQRRFREERSHMFSELRAHGIEVHWNTPIERLRELIKDFPISTGEEARALPYLSRVTSMASPVVVTPPATAKTEHGRGEEGRTGDDSLIIDIDSCAPAAPPLELALGEEGTVVAGEPSAKVRAVQLEAEFCAFYAAYPRKKAPDAARRAYAKARRTASAAQILAAVHRERWAEDKNFVPYPASWLNAGEWREEADMAAARPGRAVDARFVGWEGMDHLWLKRWRSASPEAREGMVHAMSLQAPKALKYIQGGGE